MHQRIRAAGVVNQAGTRLDLRGVSAPVVVGRVCDDVPLMATEAALGRSAPDRLVRGLAAAAMMVGAHRVVLAVDREDRELLAGLKLAANETRLELRPLPARYPMDPQSLLCDLADAEGKSVPAAGLDRALVLSARELWDLAGALDGRLPLRRTVTVAGQVRQPSVLQVPIGTPMAALVQACGGSEDPAWVPFLSGLPGGRAVGQERCVDQDTDGVLILSHRHPLVERATATRADQLGRVASACAACRICSDGCTSGLRGRDLSPHLVMRALGLGWPGPDAPLTAPIESALNCIGCGLCSAVCPSLLRPGDLVMALAAELGARGVTAPASPPLRPHPDRSGRRQGVKRLALSLGLEPAFAPLPGPALRTFIPGLLVLPSRTPMGGRRIPMVAAGDSVASGDMAYLAPPESRDTDLRAPVAGVVTAVDPDDGITICPK
jgi:Na+-translocating ferredoxin:NAD+ oxidoreductase RnfC subunit